MIQLTKRHWIKQQARLEVSLNSECCKIFPHMQSNPLLKCLVSKLAGLRMLSLYPLPIRLSENYTIIRSVGMSIM